MISTWSVQITPNPSLKREDAKERRPLDLR